MKKTRLALPLLVLFVFPVAAQVEHAPTPEQCKADLDAWGSPNPLQLSVNPGLTYNDIYSRMAEAGQCMKTDSANAAGYGKEVQRYQTANLIRMQNYIMRHGLMPRFLEEDKQGLR